MPFYFTAHGFILPLHISQQLTQGLKGFFDLARIASFLNLSIVQPYVQETFYKGAPRIDLKHPALKLGTLFNTSDLKNYLEYCCPNSELASYKEFLERSSRHVLYLIFSSSSKDKSRDKISSGKQHSKVIEMNAHASNADPTAAKGMQNLNNWVIYVGKQEKHLVLPFIHSRLVIVDALPSEPLQLSEITEVLGTIVQKHMEQYGSTTVILDSWVGIQNHPTSFYYYIPQWTWNGDNQKFYSVGHSEAVINATRMFAKSNNHIYPVIGVHIRAEQFLVQRRVKLLKKDEIDPKKCLKELHSLLNNGSVTYATNENVHVFHDLGKYGSLSCKYYKYCYREKADLISWIELLGFPIVSFDPSQFESLMSMSTNRAFVALVEKEYLSRVDVLVTVGWGGFQGSIVKRFLKHSKVGAKNLHRICFIG